MHQIVNRRSWLKFMASLPIVGLVAPTQPGTIIGYTKLPVKKTLFVGDEASRCPVFELKGVPLPVVHSEFWNQASQIRGRT